MGKIKRFYGDIGTIISQGAKSRKLAGKVRSRQKQIKSMKNDDAAVRSVVGGSSGGSSNFMSRYRAASSIASDPSNFSGSGVKMKKKKKR